MKIKVKDFIDEFRIFIGDETKSVPSSFIISALNWAFMELPAVPKLDRAFSRHYTKPLDARGHYKWKLNGNFQRLTNIPMLYFYTSTGGDPCPLNLCNRDAQSFYAKNGLVEKKQWGKPCEYTIEQEYDEIYLVFDRPSNVPIIVDYIAFGYPKPVKNAEDIIEISAPIKNLIFGMMQMIYFRESSDFAFAGAIQDYLDNKKLAEVIQLLNKRFGCEKKVILGEV